MVFTIKKIFFFVIFFLSCICVFAEMSYKIDGNTLLLSIKTKVKKNSITVRQKEKSVEVDFITDDNMNISQEFWGIPLSRIYSKQNGNKVRLILDFIDKSVKPSVSYNSDVLNLKIIFPNEKTENTYKSSGVYYRLIVGLLITLVFIMVIVFFMKVFFKKNLNSELPGVGRILGKLDIMPGKSIVFFELAEKIYLLGVTSDGVNIIDKITDEVEINLIKSGFASKANFSSYLKFFSKNDLDKDLDVASTIIKDKVNRLKKK